MKLHIPLFMLLAACLAPGAPAGAGELAPAGSGASTPQAPAVVETAPEKLLRLTLREAVRLAQDNHVLARLAEERRVEAQGLAEVGRSALFPQLLASASQRDLTQNLAAGPFSALRIPGATGFALVGPYSLFDARVRLVQTLVDLAALDRARAGEAREALADAQARLSREQVAALASLAYVNAWEGTRALDATRADLELAQTLLDLARNRYEAGVVAGVDVTRAESQLATAQLRLAQAENLDRDRRLELLRATGLPLDSVLELVDDADGVAAAQVHPFEELLPTAEASRTELQVARERVQAATLDRQAAEAERLPRLQLEADYGLSGRSPTWYSLPTRSVGLVVSFPLFEGGRLSGAETAAASRERQARISLDDLRVQVEQDVRRAFDAIRTSGSARTAAESGLVLAERELRMSRHRFENGVADSVELTTAQNNLERARLALVVARAQVARARISLAAASGTTGGLDTRLAPPPASGPGGGR